VAGKNLADRSTMEVVRARQVGDGRTGQVATARYQPRLFVWVEAVLGLYRDSSRTLAFGLVE